MTSASVIPLPPNNASESIDFLRRMASMVSGRNGEMLLRAAAMIESLAQRATSAEQLYHRQQEESTRNAQLREVAEGASDRLLAQIDALRTQLADAAVHAAAERARLEEHGRALLARAEDAEARLAAATAELEELQASVDEFNASVVAVPVEVLRLARAQFDFLSDGFAKKGDVISQAISEIGGCAIEQALAGTTFAEGVR